MDAQVSNEQHEWRMALDMATRYPTSFSVVYTYAETLLSGGYNYLDTAKAVAEKTGHGFSPDQEVHMFQFTDVDDLGVLILTTDGLVGYMGEPL